jgi:hypothetical protein
MTIGKEFTGNSLSVLWEFSGRLLGICLSIGLGFTRHLPGIYWAFTWHCTRNNAANCPLEGEK